MESSSPHVIEVPHGSPEYDDTVALRRKWLREPLGIDFTDADRAMDAKSIHVAYYLGKELVGCLVLTPLDSEEIRMRQVVVRPDLERQGIGRALVKSSEEAARRLGHTKMVVHARDVGVGFYERLGYRTVGEPFVEIGLPHQTMEKELAG